MARIRTIKPEFWVDEKLGPADPLTRLVFLGLISQADDAGRLIDSVKMLDGLLFPYTDDSCAASLEALDELGRIERYADDSGRRLIQIVGWAQHQKVKNPSAFVYPAPQTQQTEQLTEPSVGSTENLRRTGVEAGPPIPDPRSPIPEVGSTIPEVGAVRAEGGDAPDGVRLFAERQPDAAAALGRLKHPGGKDATAATLRMRFLYIDGTGNPDDSVRGLDLDERIRLVGAALIELQDQGGTDWNARHFASFVRRLRKVPPADSEAAQYNAEVEDHREIRNRMRAFERAEMQRLTVPLPERSA